MEDLFLIEYLRPDGEIEYYLNDDCFLLLLFVALLTPLNILRCLVLSIKNVKKGR